MGETAAIIVGLVFILLYFAIIGLGIADYVVTALSLYTIADRRKISNPWMAWLPFTNNWLIGAIVDHHDLQQGVKRKWRVVLLTLSLIFCGGFIISYISLFVGLFSLGLQLDGSEPEIGQVLAFIIPFYIIFILVIVVGTSFEVCRVICLYKIYEVTAPIKAIKYLLLSLFVPLASAICLMKCKNSLYGLPKPENSEIAVDASSSSEQNIVDNTPTE